MSCWRFTKSGTAKRERSLAHSPHPRTSEENAVSLDHAFAGEYEKEHVHHVYDEIASHFSSTRYRAWPRIRHFLETLPPCTMVADVGCGNGKYFSCAQRIASFQGTCLETSTATFLPMPRCNGEANGNLIQSLPTCRYLLGMDYSQPLLRQAQRDVADPNFDPTVVGKAFKLKRKGGAKRANVEERQGIKQPRTDTLRCDARRCPLRSGIFDAVLSIAVIHHYATYERRLEAIVELLRLARPAGGLVLVYVWAQEQASTGKPCKRLMNTTTGDALVPWEVHDKFCSTSASGQRLFYRFYHFFSDGELEQLCMQAAKHLGVVVVVREAYYDKENWCILLERQEDVVLG